MEYEKIKQLIDDFGNSKLNSMELDFPDGTKIRMKKEEEELDNVNDLSKKEIEVNKEIENNYYQDGNVIKSPMVGTFYSKPSPESEPYVEVGKRVQKGDVLCIIEAMKLMNEIESDFDGEIKEVLIKDGEMVEYGTPLFIIK